MNKKTRGKLNNTIFLTFILWCSLFIYLVLVVPFLLNGIPSGHDIRDHTIYLRLFSDAFAQGQIPVRWIEGVSPGFSQPLFFFYEPLYYYLAQVPHGIGFSLLFSSKIILLFTWLLSGALMFAFVKNLTKSTLAGMASALVYVFSPYHIEDIFVRAAYPEAVALGLIPGLFWATERLFITRKKIYVPLISLFFALVLIAHPPTLFMFIFPYICFLVFLFIKGYFTQDISWQTLLFILFGLLGGIDVSAFFWLPAFIDQRNIQTILLHSDSYDFHAHFVCFQQLFTSNWGYGYSISGCNDGMSFQIGSINLIIFFTSVYVVIKEWRKRDKKYYSFLLWIFLSMWSVFMTMSLSLPFWNTIPYLSFVQFPWRFLSVVIFSVSVLAGLLFSRLRMNFLSVLCYFIFMIIFILSVYSYLHPKLYYPPNYFRQDSAQFYQNSAQGEKYISPQTGYFPKSAVLLPKNRMIPEKEMESSKEVNIQVMHKTFTNVIYVLSLKQPAALTLDIHYFPGWHYFIDGKEVTNYSINMYGYPVFQVSQGKHNLQGIFENTPTVSAATFLSIISVVFLLLFSLFG